jgi:hypothetical protein
MPSSMVKALPSFCHLNRNYICVENCICHDNVQELLFTRETLYGKRMRKHIDLLICIVHPKLVEYMSNMNIHM